ncbi:MAG TPA: hypothetical protein V6D11_19915 [Waterburya sp.]|jgi:hypothetical protein
MLQPKRSWVAILLSTAIASGVFLGSTSSAQPCELSKSNYQEQDEQTNWLHSPWAVVLILPGLALATALSVGERYYRN